MDEALVRKAKNEELKFFNTKGVWRIVPGGSCPGHARRTSE